MRATEFIATSRNSTAGCHLVARKQPLTLFQETLYEGRSICNENSPVYPKVLNLHT